MGRGKATNNGESIRGRGRGCSGGIGRRDVEEEAMLQGNKRT